MKKLLTTLAICAVLMLVVTPFAQAADHIDICGTAYVTSITIHEGCCIDADACDVVITFTGGEEVNYEQWELEATAKGDMLNTALLKAWNEVLEVGMCLYVELAPLTVRVTSVSF
jgi:hypothetical protein